MKNPRDQWHAMVPRQQPEILVTIVSNNPELAAMSATIIEPRRLVLLHTHDYANRLESVKKNLTKYRFAGAVETVELAKSLPDSAAIRGSKLARLLAEVAVGQAVFDLTPGTKEMTLTLLLEFARPGDPLYYLRHRWHQESKRVEPFSEEIFMPRWNGNGAYA